MRIELMSSEGQTDVLPLNYTRFVSAVLFPLSYVRKKRGEQVTRIELTTPHSTAVYLPLNTTLAQLLLL